MAYEKEVQAAVEAVTEAAKLCEQVRQDIPEAIEKEDRSPVTVADFGSQALICRALARIFPDDPVVGEEESSALSMPGMADALARVTGYVARQVPGARPEDIRNWIDHGNGTVASRFWTVDPVDGTKGFLRGDQYAIALALIEDGQVRLGVLGCPAMPSEAGNSGVLYYGVFGGGSFVKPLHGGQAMALKVAGVNDRATMCFVESVESSHSDQNRQARIARVLGITEPPLRVDSQAKYGIIASGRAALYLRLPSPGSPGYRENIWDHAAGSLIVEEAGGRVTDMHGKPLDFAAPQMTRNRGVIASNGIIHDRVLRILAEH